MKVETVFIVSVGFVRRDTSLEQAEVRQERRRTVPPTTIGTRLCTVGAKTTIPPSPPLSKLTYGAWNFTSLGGTKVLSTMPSIRRVTLRAIVTRGGAIASNLRAPADTDAQRQAALGDVAMVDSTWRSARRAVRNHHMTERRSEASSSAQRTAQARGVDCSRQRGRGASREPRSRKGYFDFKVRGGGFLFLFWFFVGGATMIGRDRERSRSPAAFLQDDPNRIYGSLRGPWWAH